MHAMILGIGEGDYPVKSMFYNAMGNRINQGAKTIALFSEVQFDGGSLGNFLAEFPVGGL